MAKFYIVYGRTGKYEDARTWYLGWRSSEKECLDYVSYLNDLCKQFKLHEYNLAPLRVSELGILQMRKIDPNFDNDCLTGTWYDYFPLKKLKSKKINKKELNHILYNSPENYYKAK